MAKPDPWRRDATRYPFSIAVQTRFGDMDMLRHINNVALAAIFEEGRVHFSRGLHVARAPTDVRWLIVDVSIAYLGESYPPDDIVVTSGIGRIGRSSWTILSGAFQNGGCVAVCDTTMVYSGAAGPLPIPDDVRGALAARAIAPP